MNFKKSVICIIAALIFLTMNTSSAQLSGFAIKGGYNISNNSIKEDKSRSGFNVYLSKDFFKHPVLQFTIEAGFTQKGYNEESFTENEFGILTPVEIYNKLDYIDISAMGKFRFTDKNVIPYLLTGPSFGIRVKATVTSSSPETEYYHQMAINNYKKISFGFKIGGGVEICLAKLSLLAEVRYNYDLTDSYDLEFNPFGDFDRPVNNRVTEFMIGIKF